MWRKKTEAVCPTDKPVAVQFANGYVVSTGYVPAEDFDWTDNNGAWNIVKYFEKEA